LLRAYSLVIGALPCKVQTKAQVEKGLLMRLLFSTHSFNYLQKLSPFANGTFIPLFDPNVDD
jgi:hypothetical protein